MNKLRILLDRIERVSTFAPTNYNHKTMRHLYFSFLACLVPLVDIISQNDYCPFVEEGKVWVVFSYRGTPSFPTTQTFELAGDTTISNHLCKKLVVVEKPYFQDNRYEPVVGYLMAIYEKEKKVFFCLKDHTEFLLMYDFGAKEGDELEVWCPNIPFFGDRLEKFHYQVGPITTSGNFTVLTLYDIGAKEYMERETGQELPVDTYSFTWVEGIGSYYSPLINGGAGKGGWNGLIIDCHVGDYYLLYDKESYDYLNTLTGISAPTIVNGKSVNSKWYDLSGRPLATPPTKGIYIRGGKKVVVK